MSQEAGVPNSQLEPSSNNDDSEGDESLTFDFDARKSDSDIILNRMLDFASPYFCPKLALALTDVKPPVPDAPRCLNLIKYSQAVTSPSKKPVEKHLLIQRSIKDIQKGSKNKTDKTAKPVAPTASTSSSSIKYPIPGRKFLPHQLPVYQPRKQHHNSLTFMQTVEGPLSAVRKAMNEKRRVKIWTRNATGIRGYCIGFVEVFDKHWNFGLRDVDEKFIRRRVVKFPAAQCENNDGEKENEERSQIKFRNSRLRTYSSSLVKSCKPIRTEQSSNIGSSNEKTLVETDELVTLFRNFSRFSSQGAPTSSANPKIAPSKSQVRKKGLNILRNSYVDPNGFTVIAKSQKFEIVERHAGQLFMMGNDIVTVETDF